MKDELLNVGKLIYSRRTELELTQKEVADDCVMAQKIAPKKEAL